MACKEQFTTINDALLVRAPAKINLSLLIAGKRADGFHEIETLMAKVDWYDEVLFEHGTARGIELICLGDEWAPQGAKNLVYHGCSMLCEAANKSPDIRVTLRKNIPAGTGLGGASSDAAAALIGLNRFGELGISDEQLLSMAGRLGSDVPFFFGGPLAFCSGRGEKIKKIKEKFPFQAVLVLPNVTVSTKRVYENYIHDNDRYNQLAVKINDFIRKKKIDSAAKMCANMLECCCFELHEELAELKLQVESLGVAAKGGVCLSGSGSTMYWMVRGADEGDVKRYQSVLMENVGCKSVVVHDNRW